MLKMSLEEFLAFRQWLTAWEKAWRPLTLVEAAIARAAWLARSQQRKEEEMRNDSTTD